MSDNKQLRCFALALWNGKDPIIKERLGRRASRLLRRRHRSQPSGQVASRESVQKKIEGVLTPAHGCLDFRRCCVC